MQRLRLEKTKAEFKGGVVKNNKIIVPGFHVGGPWPEAPHFHLLLQKKFLMKTNKYLHRHQDSVRIH